MDQKKFTITCPFEGQTITAESEDEAISMAQGHMKMAHDQALTTDAARAMVTTSDTAAMTDPKMMTPDMPKTTKQDRPAK